MQGIGQGIQLQAGTTATEAQTLAINANDRIALQSVYEDEWIRQLAGLMCEIMQANYTPGRWMRIVGEDQSIGIIQISQGLKEAKYDIDVEPGATLPFDEEKRVIKYKMAYDMLGSPVANPMLPDMLRVLGIPNSKKILTEYAVYQKYLQFVQLYEATKAGKVAPEKAVQMVVQAAMQEFAGSAQGQMMQTGEQTNA
jgi:hypothetical protein